MTLAEFDPDLLDALSMLFGGLFGFLSWTMLFMAFSIIKSIFTFIKWLIKRKDECKNGKIENY